MEDLCLSLSGHNTAHPHCLKATQRLYFQQCQLHFLFKMHLAPTKENVFPHCFKTFSC